jgi:endonuclease/exonuclease/phosphatase family metal-dependent hydrolase
MAGRDTVRLMTWNVWWRFGAQWRERQVGIASTIAAQQPDIVGLQEAWVGRGSSQAEVLAAPLRMYSVFAGPSLPDLPAEPESPDHVDVDLGIAVLSRWPVRHSWVHALPTSRAVAPVALVTAVEHPGGLLYVVCTCIEHHAHLADDHVAQARELARLVSDLGAHGGELPVVLLGDLNAGPDGPEIRALTEEMVDAWEVADQARPDVDGITLSSAVPFAPLGAVKQLDRRIDYVLFRPSQEGASPSVSQAYVVTDTVNDLHPSDHYAVVADLEV